MSTVRAIPTTNRLLAALPPKDQVQLLANCEQVELTLSEVLHRPNEPISHVYFPVNSFISMVLPTEGAAGLEVGMVGNEGMLGVTLMLRVDATPFLALVQGPGFALRIAAPLFLDALERSAALQAELKRYLYVLLNQIAQTAVCNRFHAVEARLARWLLMTQDRAGADTFYITHVFLAYMLGVRRVSITTAASSLQKRKIISYQRGEITILDRIGLEAVSCQCYRSDQDAYQRVMGYSGMITRPLLFR